MRAKSSSFAMYREGGSSGSGCPEGMKSIFHKSIMGSSPASPLEIEKEVRCESDGSSLDGDPSGGTSLGSSKGVTGRVGVDTGVLKL